MLILSMRMKSPRPTLVWRAMVTWHLTNNVHCVTGDAQLSSSSDVLKLCHGGEQSWVPGPGCPGSYVSVSVLHSPGVFHQSLPGTNMHLTFNYFIVAKIDDFQDCLLFILKLIEIKILSGGYIPCRASMQSCANARSLVNTAGNVYGSNWDILYSSPYLFSRQCQCSQWRNWRMCNNFIQDTAPWDLTPRLGSEKQTWLLRHLDISFIRLQVHPLVNNHLTFEVSKD